jgi:hypothetical protein
MDVFVIHSDLSPSRQAQAGSIITSNGGTLVGTVSHDGKATKYTLPSENVSACQSELRSASFQIGQHATYFDVT